MILTKVRKVVTTASLLASLALISLVVTKYWINPSPVPEVATVPVTLKAKPSTGAGVNFTLFKKPRPLSEFQFVDGEGRTLSLADFRGKLVLLNIWATWCVPCRREMPALDRLQAKLGGKEFEVLALSIDKEGSVAVKAFYEELELDALSIYVDASTKVTREIGIVGIPTTLLVGRDGNELARLVGPAEWDDSKIISFLRKQITRTKQLQTTSIDQPTNDKTQENNR